MMSSQPSNHPQMLNRAGLAALKAGDAASAVTLLGQAVAADPTALALWLNLATAQRAAGAAADALASFEQALTRDPYCLPALLGKARLLTDAGHDRAAADAYAAALRVVGGATDLPETLAAELAFGRALIADRQQALAAALDRHLAPARAAHDAAAAARFERSVDGLTGRRPLYVSQPTTFTFAGLAQTEFVPRAELPLLPRLEAGTAAIRQEFLNLATSADFEPYVAYGAGLPLNQWSALNHSLDWSAFFLWRNGRRQDANCARCPETARIVADLPLFDLPDWGPTVFFSLLRPGAQIPPHCGETNIRTIVHLPLLVPPDCWFRVGGTRRPWVEGEAFGFDDTVEHEARNGSDQLRAVLIVDVWNPQLTATERQLVVDLYRGLDEHRRRDGGSAG